MNVVCFRTSKTENLHGYYIKASDFAGFRDTHPEIEISTDKTQYKPNSYILKHTQWIPIDEVLKILDSKSYQKFYNKVKVYVLGNDYKPFPYFYFKTS